MSPVFWSLLACTSPDVEVTATATVDDAITTLVHVTWDPPLDDVTVEYEGRTATGAGEATLYGLHADTDVSWRITRGDWHGDWRTVHTGLLPEGIPLLETEGDLGADYVLFSWHKFPFENTGVYIVDADGAIVWYWLSEWGLVPVARPSGDALLLMHSKHDVIEDATIERVPLDGSGATIDPFPMAHHDVIEVPGLRYTTIVGEVREIDGENVVGDKIVEVSDDGTQRTVWNAFDNFPVVHHEAWDAGTYTSGADWSHANGLIYDPAEDVYYLSIFYLRCIVKIARTTGETLWVLGGDDGTVPITNDPGSSRQHAPELVDGEIMFFDNGYGDDAGSRLVRYAIQPDGTATRTWEWRHPDGLFTFVLGDVDTLPDGGHLSAWGNYSQILRTDADDAIQWKLQLDPGYLVAQAEIFSF